jgi:hypothetical protein
MFRPSIKYPSRDTIPLSICLYSQVVISYIKIHNNIFTGTGTVYLIQNTREHSESYLCICTCTAHLSNVRTAEDVFLNKHYV